MAEGGGVRRRVAEGAGEAAVAETVVRWRWRGARFAIVSPLFRHVNFAIVSPMPRQTLKTVKSQCGIE